MTDIAEVETTDADQAIRVHRVPTLRWWIIAGIVVAFAVSFQQITQPDYNTHHRAAADEWLWVVVPAVAMLVYGARRVWRSRIETGPDGLAVVRAVDRDEVPWARLAGLELRPTPNRAGTLISARLVDRRMVRLGTVPGRKPKHRARAEAFVAALEADRAHFTGTAPASMKRDRREGTPTMSHIIGRPDDDLLDIMLGHDADPEQAFIGGSEQGPGEGDGLDDRPLSDEPTVTEL